MPVSATYSAGSMAKEMECLAALQRPFMAPFVGGQTKPFRCDAEVAAELMEAASRTYCF